MHREQPLRVEAEGVWTAGTPVGSVLRLPMKNGEGRYIHDDPEQLAADGQVLLRYSLPDGTVDAAANPNGSVANIAAVTNRNGNVAGLMPHPEHAVDELLGSTDGRALFHGVMRTVRERAGTPA